MARMLGRTGKRAKVCPYGCCHSYRGQTWSWLRGHGPKKRQRAAEKRVWNHIDRDDT